LLLVCVVFCDPVAAQDVSPSAGERTEGATSVAPNASLVSPHLFAAPDAWLTQQPTAPAPPPSDERRRRRPSMVGYINDPTIGSQVRFRFDTGTGINAADRAEFFYAKCGCYRGLPPTDAAFDPDAPGPPGIATDIDFQQLYLQAEYGFSDRVSLYGELPVRWISPQSFVPGAGVFGDQSGISDLRAGLKWGAVANERQLLTVQLQGDFPTGDAGQGLGVDHFSFEPALLYHGSVNERVNLEGQFGLVLPVGGADGLATTEESFAGNVIYYGIGPSFEVYSSDALRFAPVVELVGWHVLSGFQTSTLSEADGTNIVNLKIGARAIMAGRNSLYAGFGWALTDDEWYDNIFRLEYRLGF
jgi:hypothetical protein